MSRSVKPNVDNLIRQYGPERIIEALRPFVTDERAARIDSVLSARLSGLTVAIENLHDPHNGAAVVRSVEAVGLTSLHVAEPIERFQFSPAVAIGSEKWIRVLRHQGFTACARILRGAGFRMYAACPDAEMSMDDIDVSQPSAVVFGNEHEGLSRRAIDACDAKVAIPMHGFTQSLNLSVSVAVSIFQLAARRRALLGRLGDLEDQERAILQARWYSLSVRGVQSILERVVS
ncbi:tRNA/rRNA methyltransferase (SpoU) [Haliangium ochraceum DSM 14365]|uniref:tRNA (guanosine(18)-2'-O)-methyltransferase n=1 Tax=Haliangium ochraceum (strain DSM 14365 / JCM 11303 / SMP-2) TaxID=502025 RepID=D0LNM3_HALO1|nr:tRNA/rRNA methyltransferase (SpoU) [Haliangium ochraceum DSM 14365]